MQRRNFCNGYVAPSFHFYNRPAYMIELLISIFIHFSGLSNQVSNKTHLEYVQHENSTTEKGSKDSGFLQAQFWTFSSLSNAAGCNFCQSLLRNAN